jgi:hypothetical protein
MTGIPSSSNTGNTGSSSSAGSAIGIYYGMASCTNALERVQQEIGEEATSLRPKNTDMAQRVSSWSSWTGAPPCLELKSLTHTF